MAGRLRGQIQVRQRWESISGMAEVKNALGLRSDKDSSNEGGLLAAGRRQNGAEQAQGPKRCGQFD